ncbi:alkaline phosphatase family protein [Ruegeria profundi]|uniref:alkaline phosphatase family protein n=1 Tax=Ruegeria profundi TaxID=1685378 RepID=UPI001CD4B17A|nr:alkaline phosphatase family protein [Ruegeria profundi]MCA0926786.1 alkaline phosphatase family protein [Ruegeria profundi]
MPERYVKTLLIGLDGATYDILDPLVSEGVMPNLGRLMEGGSRGILRSTMHPLTPPAWATLMTGRSPGNHGVFDFIRVDRTNSTPTYTLTTSADLKVPTIWQIASEAGMRVTTLNYPTMFPAKPIDGVVIPGYVPWSYLGRAIYPRETYKMLKEEGVFKAREMSTDWQHERKAVQGLAENDLQDWVQFHITRERRWFEITLKLMERVPSELTSVLFDGVDRIQHLCYHLIDPATRGDYRSQSSVRARDLALQYFRDVDNYIAQMVAKAGDQASVIIASDHGFTRSGARIFYANSWLESLGLLKWKPDVPLDNQGRVALDENTEATTLIDWGPTKAYALSSSSNAIFIRVASENDPDGVPPEQYEAFRDDLISKLKSLVDSASGKPVVRDVFTREMAFPGTESARAPDLTLQMADYSFLSVLRADEPVKDRKIPYATHHPDGVIIASGPAIKSSGRVEPMRIVDVAPTVLYSLGLDIPSSFEGRVGTDLFDPAYVATHVPEISDTAGKESGTDSSETLSGDAEEQIRARLKALGYL